jgi:hypothetical protein
VRQVARRIPDARQILGALRLAQRIPDVHLDHQGHLIRQGRCESDASDAVLQEAWGGFPVLREPAAEAVQRLDGYAVVLLALVRAPCRWAADRSAA